jgi:MerR family transcriptional regulator, light-induced transcriptional regulator
VVPYKKVERPVVSSDKPSAPVELSIGTLSSATGVPVDTLRTWERRYGFPAPVTRTEGSHRRYSAETIAQVQLIVRALELGHRPSAVVGRDPAELRRLVGSMASTPATPDPSRDEDRRVIARWLELTRAMDGDTLVGEFHRGLAEMTAIAFLERRLGPYLQAMGDRWAAGVLRVSQEHYASEKTREFLSAQWRAANESATPARAVAVLATPPGEQHALGLHMAAWVVALARVRVVFLGANTPMNEVAFAAQHYDAHGVALSVAEGYREDLEAHHQALAAQVRPEVSIVFGGADGWKAGTSAQVLNSFEDLFGWAEMLVKTAGQQPGSRADA